MLKQSFALSILATTLTLFLSVTHANELKDFTTDGCSLSPDGLSLQNPNAFFHCCLIHDIAYWKGGTRQERLEADTEFKACVSKRSNELIGEIYYSGVRLGGSNRVKTGFHWGYGWKTLRSYKPLTIEENKLAEEKLKDIDWDAITQPFFPELFPRQQN